MGKGCLAGKLFFHINHTGDVYPCPAFKNTPKFNLGNLFETSFTEIIDRFKNSDETYLQELQQINNYCAIDSL